MKTIVLEEPGRLAFGKGEPPERPAPDDVIVRVRRIGVCGTDLHAFRGRQPFFTYPRILGHELGVEVVAVGRDVLGIQVGDRAAVEPYLYCGNCVACRRGKTNCCVRLQCLGVHTDGGMRERISLPAARLHLSSRLSLEQLALVETLGIGAHAVARGALDPTDVVVVIGAGPIGLAVAQFAKLEASLVVVLEPNEHRREFCRQQLGIVDVLPGGPNFAGELADYLGGELPTVVFDATGNPASMMQAFSFVANGGKLVFVGLFQGDVTFADPEFHRREITLLASRNSTAGDFRRIIKLIEEGTIDTMPWITHRAPFDAVVDEFPTWLDPANRVVKAMIEC